MKSKKRTFDAEPDLRLIHAARAGDERAFTTLLRTYEELVYSFSYKLCRDEERASEVLQDTFVNVFRKLDQFDEKSKFTTWLYRIVANNCLMKLRRSKLARSSVSIHAPDGFTDDPEIGDDGIPVQSIAAWKDTPLDGVMTKELRRHLDEAIGKLPPDHRVVFVLRDIEDRSAEETAKILHLSIPAVKSRLHRARAFLREQLNGYMTA